MSDGGEKDRICYKYLCGKSFLTKEILDNLVLTTYMDWCKIIGNLMNINFF